MIKEQVLADELQKSQLNDNTELTKQEKLCQTILYLMKSSNKKIIYQHQNLLGTSECDYTVCTYSSTGTFILLPLWTSQNC